MILLPGAVKIFVATYPVSLRKSFDGLMNEVRSVLCKNPLCGHVFVFLNRRKTMVKLLFWSRGGFMILHKRLESGRFAFRDQVRGGALSVQIEEHELVMLLEGLEARTTRQSRRWNPPSPSRKRHSEAEIVH